MIGAGGSQVVKAEETTELDLSSATVFPDAEFRKKLKTYDTDNNGKLSDAEIKAITSISTFWLRYHGSDGHPISDITGEPGLLIIQCQHFRCKWLDVTEESRL